MKAPLRMRAVWEDFTEETRKVEDRNTESGNQKEKMGVRLAKEQKGVEVEQRGAARLGWGNYRRRWRSHGSNEPG